MRHAVVFVISVFLFIPLGSAKAGWSAWEDLGGVINSAPTVSSWEEGRLDTFARGRNMALWHKWWNGSRWSDWENLGGVLMSAPDCVSWAAYRIDCFARGQNSAMWHKWYSR